VGLRPRLVACLWSHVITSYVWALVGVALDFWSGDVGSAEVYILAGSFAPLSVPLLLFFVAAQALSGEAPWYDAVRAWATYAAVFAAAYAMLSHHSLRPHRRRRASAPPGPISASPPSPE
jgi:hypothetical protein